MGKKPSGWTAVVIIQCLYYRDQAYIESYDSAIIRNVETHLTYSAKQSAWKVKLVIHLESVSDNIINGNLKAILTHHQNKSQVIEVTSQIDALKFPPSGRLAFVKKMLVPEDFVELWWPAGHGNQTLYHLQVIFQSGAEQSTKELKIGFRTIELIQDPIEGHQGLTFYFKINRIPIFMKGSNWIPSNILPEITGTEEGKQTIVRLMTAAKVANMNMLRVWGGGVYETDFFYTLADEMGILIWQDFMFACSYYPSSDEFLK